MIMQRSYALRRDQVDFERGLLHVRRVSGYSSTPVPIIVRQNRILLLLWHRVT
jgi:hypothetical protein